MPGAGSDSGTALPEGENATVRGGTTMEAALDRRKGPGRRYTDRKLDTTDPRAVRGLMHDLGHQMTTLSYLVEAVRGEADLPGGARDRMETLALGMSRMLDTIAYGLSAATLASDVSMVDLRSLVREAVQLAQVQQCASVVLMPGPDVTLEVNPTLLWRVLTNVIENAARATGPEGQVEISLDDHHGAAIDVTDDGPGFGLGRSGTASLGLSVVTSLLATIGGSLEVRSPRARGTRVSIQLPAARSGGSENPVGDA
jgi:signal transduction histidine kinase